MKRNKKSLTICAAIFILVGLAQLVLSFTYHRKAAALATDRFVHQYYPTNDGAAYEGLFDQAMTLQQQVGGLTTSFHALSGTAAVIVGFLLLTFAFDKYVDVFRKRPGKRA